MLKKLMKYEWKTIRNVLLVINAFTVFSTILGVIAMHNLAFGKNTGETFPNLVAILLFMVYYATIIGVSFAMTVYIAVRFYRNLYTDEGYLMHTLPVTSRQLVLSKLIVHSGCLMLTTALIYISVCSLIVPFIISLENEFASFSQMASALLEECRDIFGLSVPRLLLCTITTLGISTISGVLSIYCSVSLGQMFRKHKIMGSILCYIAILCLIQTLSTILLMPQMISSMSGGRLNMEIYFKSVFLTTGIISMFLGIIFYLVTLHLMSKKLNLD